MPRATPGRFLTIVEEAPPAEQRSPRNYGDETDDAEREEQAAKQHGRVGQQPPAKVCRHEARPIRHQPSVESTALHIIRITG